jgi:hypothetical protein
MRKNSGQTRPPQILFSSSRPPASHPIPVYHEAIRLCLSQGTADLGAALAGRQAGSLEGGLGGLGDLLISLGEDELDVAGVGHVGVDLKGKNQFLCSRRFDSKFRERTRP